MPRSSVSFKKALTYLLPIASALLLALLTGLAVYRFRSDSKIVVGQIIAAQVEQLAQIFKRIDRDCRIVGFDHEKNYIDFLNVKGFLGSQVGSMNLAHPIKWEGPYLADNPTIQEKYYMMVITSKGWFIAPGDGVKLANGKVIGKDIVYNKDTDFDELVHNPNALSFKGRPLAVRIK